MKSCNDCVHHRVCERHNKMAVEISERKHPVTLDFIVFCALNKDEVLRMINRVGCIGIHYMHEIAEASIANYCPNYLVSRESKGVYIE